MTQLNYKNELIKLENDIVEKTLANDKDTVELIAANLNSLYGLISILHGSNSYIFPITTEARSQKFLIMLYSITAFQLSSSILDLSLSGKYPEASTLMRSLVETVGFAEYYFLNPPSPKLISGKISDLPKRQTVFKYLSKHGNLPKGGPKGKFEEYNDAAHSDIWSMSRHWPEAIGEPQTTYIWLRKYNGLSFHELMRDMIVRLIAINQIFKDVFQEQIDQNEDKSWFQYWQLGHDHETINRIFPDLV
jgi:hypothetical protein